MMSDPGASVPMPAMINSILSECVWGTVQQGDSGAADAPSWKMNSSVPSKNPTQTDSISYGEFLENVLCVTKPERKYLKTNFTEAGKIIQCDEKEDHIPLCMFSTYFGIINGFCTCNRVCR
jgi:hypothetical protein